MNQQTDRQSLAHIVFFQLQDDSTDAKEKLVAECRKYLSGHPGTAFFTAGTPVEDLDRPVNVRDFDVSLVVVFDSRADHDAYQAAPAHLEFIDRNKDNWASVRVFDSHVGS